MLFRVRIANPNQTLLPGMYVTVQLSVGSLNKGFRVPQATLLRDGQGAYVLVIGKDGTAVQKRVETVSVVDNHWIISKGLEDGDQVIVTNLQMLQPGTPVTAAPEQGAQPEGAPPPAGEAPAGPAQG